MVRQALSPSEHTRCEQNVVDYDKNFYIDFCARFTHKGLSLAHEGRFLEAILNAEQGVASRGCGSQSQAREVRYPARQALRPGCEELAVRIRRKCRRRKRGTRPKIATVERREARVPIARDAGHPAECPACRVTVGQPGAAAPGRLSALRHPSSGWRQKKRITNREREEARGRRRNEKGKDESRSGRPLPSATRDFAPPGCLTSFSR
jgi:hypothetical protein